MGYAIGVVAVVMLVALIRMTSPDLRSMTNRRRADNPDRVIRTPPPTGDMGRDRMPAMWYTTPGDDTPTRQAEASPAEQPVPARTIRWWTAGGLSFVALDVLAWLTGYPVLGDFVATLAAFVLGVALHERRRNRWLNQASTWNTGYRHDFPPTGKAD